MTAASAVMPHDVQPLVDSDTNFSSGGDACHEPSLPQHAAEPPNLQRTRVTGSRHDLGEFALGRIGLTGVVVTPAGDRAVVDKAAANPLPNATEANDSAGPTSSDSLFGSLLQAPKKIKAAANAQIPEFLRRAWLRSTQTPAETPVSMAPHILRRSEAANPSGGPRLRPRPAARRGMHRRQPCHCGRLLPTPGSHPTGSRRHLG